MIKEYLEPLGYQVELAHNGLDGVDRASSGDIALELTPVEYELLECLARSEERVKSREHLVDEIAHRDFDVFDRSVDVHASALRKKLGDDPKSPRFIRTVRAVGYLMIDPAREP